MNSVGFQPGPVTRPVGLETEFGVLRPGDPYANPVVLSSQVVEAYCAAADVPAVRWDYEGEDPLADLRGGRLQRSAAHPSQLTDDPTRPAPSGDAPPPAPWGSRARPSAAEAALPQATTAVLVNGARLYVDHAHPEYSSPEVLTPHDALVWDRAGEVVARRAMAAVGDGGLGVGDPVEIVLYKNNVDGKGAAYGSHENYLVRRELPFEELAAVLTPFLVTRPVLVGAGRVGIGQRSERPGFQVSQRADYVESEIGLQTTFNRPIVNTRDEPHADSTHWRRLHVINGDANRFDVPIYLKVATTDLLLWFLEQAHSTGAFKDALTELSRLAITADPVEEHWAVSHDPTLTYELTTRAGAMNALAIQRAYLEVISPAARRAGDPESQYALDMWRQSLVALEQWSRDGSGPAAHMVEWVAKYELCEGLRRRSGTGWDDPRLAALDIQWADLRPGCSVVDKLDAAGRIHRLVTEAEVERAADRPPEGTRATIRGTAINRHPQIVGASWTCLVLDVPGRPELLRLRLPDDVAVGPDETATILEEIGRRVTPERH